MKSYFRGLAAVAAFCFVFILISLTIKIVRSMVWGKSHGGDSVAVVDIAGVIATSSATIKEIKGLLENKSVKALVVRVNSPGGLVAPSQELYQAIRQADQKIPVIISMGSLAASGGYYCSLGGRKIFANSGSLTASIGVIMELANTEKLYHWAKIDRYTLKAGKFKDIGSPLREMTKEEHELMTAMLVDMHQQFRAAVKERRKLTDSQLDNVADGRVMTGSQAKQAGLVDELGGFEDALKEAKVMAHLPETANVIYPETNEGLLKKLLLGDSTSLFRQRVESWLESTSLISGSSGWQVMWLAPLR